MTRKVCVITGASSGIGKETAQEFISKGYFVYDLSRSGKDDFNVKHIYCDVSDYKTISAAIEEIMEEESQINIAVSNAGFGISGSLEGHEYEDIGRQIDVNFRGSAYFAKAVLPYIRASKGRIIFLSSIAGVVPIPFQTVYSATKAALMNMAQALDNEIKPSGARSIALLPGDVATPFTSARKKNKNEDTFYRNRVRKSVSRMEADEMKGMSVSLIAKQIYKLATDKHPKPVSSIGFFYRFVLILVGLLPPRLKQYIIGKMYAS